MPMPTPRSSLKAVLIASTLITAGVAGTALPPTAARAEVPMQGYADLVARVSPAVVFIEVTAKSKESTPMAGSPFEEFLRRFGEIDPQFRMPQAPEAGRSCTGSGRAS